MSTAPKAPKGKSSPLGKLNYFPIRGRGEPIRLILAACELGWEECTEYKKTTEVMGSADMPFGQCPTWMQKELKSPLSQMDAICRLIGRQTGWYGQNWIKDARVDELLGGVEDLRHKYGVLIYQSAFDKQALQAYQAEHLDELTPQTRGAHMQYIENYLARSTGKWAVGDELTIADAAVFDLFDLHVILCGNHPEELTCKLAERFPLLSQHRAKFLGIPGIAKYMSSSKRHAAINGCAKC